MKPHPLTGVKAWHVEPPEHWDEEMRERLYRPHLASVVSVDELRRHATYAYTTLADLTPFFNEDMATLAPYRARAAWRITRGWLVEHAYLAPQQSIGMLTEERIHEVQPPPAPKDLEGYDPTEDHELSLWLARVETKIEQGNLEAPTDEDPHYGKNQTSCLLSPHFARAAWPSWIDLLAAEASMVQELTDVLTKGGPLAAQKHLAKAHNIYSLEADATIRLAASEIARAYTLMTPEESRALYMARVDSIIERAEREYRINAEISATKLGALLHGAIQEQRPDHVEDIMSSIVEPRDLTDREIHSIAPPDQDPLLLDGPE